MSAWSLVLMAWLKNIGASLAVFFGVIFIVVIDLSLGPEFMGSYAQAQGKDSTWLTAIIPWSLSIATTGFQYILAQAARGYRAKKQSFGRQIAFVAGIFIALCDSMTDVGGMTSLVYGPEEGVKVKPDGADGMWWLTAIIIFAICLLHEYLLEWVLDRSGNPRMASPGMGLLLKTVDITKWLFFFFRDLAAVFGYVGVFLLDILLTGYFIHSKVEQNAHFSEWALPATIAFSVILLMFQFGLVLRMRSGTASWKQIQMWIVMALIIVDTGTDVGGLTAYLYGPEDMEHIVMPAEPTLAWWLIVGCISLLCAVCEPMIEEVSAVAGGMGKPRKPKPPKPGGGMPAPAGGVALGRPPMAGPMPPMAPPPPPKPPGTP